jgi:hypothetical protein
MATTIKVHGDRAVVTIIDVDPDEGTMTWECSAGHAEEVGYVHETLSDVINAAEVHLTHQCDGR